MRETLQPVESVKRTPLSPLVLLAALEDPDVGLLIFDEHLRVLHATSFIGSLLRLPAGFPAEVLPLLLVSALDQPSGILAKRRIAAFVSQPETGETVHLRLQDGSQLHMRFRPLGPGYFAASFETTPHGIAVSGLDSVTGLTTRACFEKALSVSLERTPPPPVTVLLIDLDRFKAVNDTLGHAVGDTLLRLVSARLQSAVRESDLVARFGGDEFAVLIAPSPNSEVPTSIALRILDLVQRTYLIEGQLVNVGVSMGIAESPGHGSDVKALLRNADLALCHSKESGRGTFTFFDTGMEKRAEARRTNELELRRALALRQLEVFYQPQVSTAAGRLVGFEALLRWRHPERGLLAPGAFLQLAEEIGVIVPIGNWVLRTACKEAMKWPAEVVIAVNASPLQFNTGRFADSVRAALKATGLPGERLEVEITEGILLNDTDVIWKTLQDLRAMKVRIAMDDFGTGYASLSQLAKFPFDKIKIDRSLAGFEGDDKKQRAIVRAITTLGRSLGVCTLAEGVEDPEQLARLQDDGCNSVQGYFYGRPMPASDLDDVIARLCSSPTAEIPQKETPLGSIPL